MRKLFSLKSSEDLMNYDISGIFRDYVNEVEDLKKDIFYRKLMIKETNPRVYKIM